MTKIVVSSNTNQILALLDQTYPEASIALSWRTPWELLVAVILSAQCTDTRVNVVTAKLFSKYKTLDDYDRANPKEFEQDIRSTGFYHNKTKNILTCAHIVRDRFGGLVPKSMDQILTLPGVARKTANVVLGTAYGIVEGIAVDTHVHRISQRLRLVELTKIGGKKLMVFERDGKTIIDYTKDADPEKIERELMCVIPRTKWFPITYLLISHGRNVCKAGNPNCERCVLRKYCPVSRV
jgi:endonuclease-3